MHATVVRADRPRGAAAAPEGLPCGRGSGSGGGGGGGGGRPGRTAHVAIAAWRTMRLTGPVACHAVRMTGPVVCHAVRMTGPVTCQAAAAQWRGAAAAATRQAAAAPSASPAIRGLHATYVCNACGRGGSDSGGGSGSGGNSGAPAASAGVSTREPSQPRRGCVVAGSGAKGPATKDGSGQAGGAGVDSGDVGEAGVSDALTGLLIFIIMRLARQIENEDVGAVADAATRAAALVQGARPLLHQSICVRGGDLRTALLADLGERGHTEQLRALTQTTEQAAQLLAKHSGRALMADDVQKLRTQVLALSRAQERIDISELSGEVSLFTRDTVALHTMSVLDEALKSVSEEDLRRAGGSRAE